MQSADSCLVSYPYDIGGHNSGIFLNTASNTDQLRKKNVKLVHCSVIYSFMLTPWLSHLACYY